jgi:hypothetical protein
MNIRLILVRCCEHVLEILVLVFHWIVRCERPHIESRPDQADSPRWLACFSDSERRPAVLARDITISAVPTLDRDGGVFRDLFCVGREHFNPPHLTSRWSQPLPALRSHFQMTKQLSLRAMLAPGSRR